MPEDKPNIVDTICKVNLLEGKEHSPLEGVPDGLSVWLGEQPRKEQDLFRYLGLYFNESGKICPGHYVGTVWIGEGRRRCALAVRPKTFGNVQMDYLSMYATCADDPEVGDNLDNIINIWPDDEQVPVPDNFPNWTELLLIAAFMKSLNVLCKRHLRFNFIQTERNLIGKVKGKVILGTQIRENLLRLRPERTVCCFQEISIDCQENRILRAALMVALRVLARHTVSDATKILNRWARQALNHLSGVPVVRIHRRDFQGIRYNGTFVHYRRPHHLARHILKRYGFNPQSDKLRDEQMKDIRQTPSTLPFAIDTAELFERYCQVLLCQQGYKVRAGYKDKNLEYPGGKVKVRPDFLCIDNEREKCWILDAKYKRRYRKKNGFKGSDIYQVVSYSRHKGVKQELCRLTGASGEREADAIAILYPDTNKEASLKLPNLDSSSQNRLIDFDVPLFIIPVPFPLYR